MEQHKLCKLAEQARGSRFENYFEICTIPMLRHENKSWEGGGGGGGESFK